MIAQDDPKRTFRPEENLPYTLVRLTYACNAACLFCNVPEEDHAGREVPPREIARSLREHLWARRGARISISGGEPTLRKDLMSVISLAVKNGARLVELQTNAIRLADRAYTKDLKRAGLSKAFVALHSHRPGIHDRLVGRRGAFQKCILGIKNALREGLEVILNPVLTTHNYPFLPAYMRFLKKTFPGIRCLSLSVVQPRGRAWRDKTLIPRYGKLDPFVREALAVAQQDGLVVNNPYCGLPLCIGGWYDHPQRCVEYCENLLRRQRGISAPVPRQEKIKPAACRSCDASGYCNGVWREYAVIYPCGDLRPLKRKNGRFSLLRGRWRP